jgi:hypothetical protein
VSAPAPSTMLVASGAQQAQPRNPRRDRFATIRSSSLFEPAGWLAGFEREL